MVQVVAITQQFSKLFVEWFVEISQNIHRFRQHFAHVNFPSIHGVLEDHCCHGFTINRSCRTQKTLIFTKGNKKMNFTIYKNLTLNLILSLLEIIAFSLSLNLYLHLSNSVDIEVTKSNYRKYVFY